MQGSLPAGGLRLCREGVEPSGTRWKVSDYIILLRRASPVASWMVLDGAIKAPSLIRFLARLVREAGQKVFLILDRLPVHRSAKVRDWLVGREAEIEVFYLPGYSPELNPDEGLNGDLKQAVTRKEPARSKAQLKRAVVGHMRRLSKLPDRVRSFFGHKTFRYAA
jgi:transposase